MNGISGKQFGKWYTVIFVMLLGACGGGGGGGGNSDSVPNERPAELEQTSDAVPVDEMPSSPTNGDVHALAGVWNKSGGHSVAGKPKSIWVISDTGAVTSYVYNKAGCYHIDRLSYLKDRPDGNFALHRQYEDEVPNDADSEYLEYLRLSRDYLSARGDNLHIANDYVGIVVSLPKAGISESDIQPLCREGLGDTISIHTITQVPDVIHLWEATYELCAATSRLNNVEAIAPPLQWNILNTLDSKVTYTPDTITRTSTTYSLELTGGDLCQPVIREETRTRVSALEGDSAASLQYLNFSLQDIPPQYGDEIAEVVCDLIAERPEGDGAIGNGAPCPEDGTAPLEEFLQSEMTNVNGVPCRREGPDSVAVCFMTDYPNAFEAIMDQSPAVLEQEFPMIDGGVYTVSFDAIYRNGVVPF